MVYAFRRWEMSQVNITGGRSEGHLGMLYRQWWQATLRCKRASVAIWMRSSPGVRQEMVNLTIYVGATWLLTGRAPTLTDLSIRAVVRTLIKAWRSIRSEPKQR
jgi:hypothetical protein